MTTLPHVLPHGDHLQTAYPSSGGSDDSGYILMAIIFSMAFLMICVSCCSSGESLTSAPSDEPSIHQHGRHRPLFTGTRGINMESVNRRTEEGRAPPLTFPRPAALHSDNQLRRSGSIQTLPLYDGTSAETSSQPSSAPPSYKSHNTI